ncbi:hypothetical protein MYX65_03185 [Acidobacteria bacterium AH-259-L09]|nr:hypothetical protein [Acidobacteria bacterium AH-259-L09]
MKDDDLGELLNKAVARHGREEIAKVLTDLSRSGGETEVLTIIANAGVHEIPQRYLRGEVYEASHGNWDASTPESLRRELCDRLARLAEKLRSTVWKRIYLVPTGHPVLSLQIKAMVYRILRLNTVDLYYKDGEYFEIEIDHRVVALESNQATTEED